MVVTGVFLRGVNLGGDHLHSSGGYDIFLARLLGSDGTHVWSKRFGFAFDDRDIGFNIAVDVNGDVAVTGSFFGTVDFGGADLSSSGSEDIFVAKLYGGS